MAKNHGMIWNFRYCYNILVWELLYVLLTDTPAISYWKVYASRVTLWNRGVYSRGRRLMELTLLNNDVINWGNIWESHRYRGWSKLKVCLISVFSTFTLPFCQIYCMNYFQVGGSWETAHLCCPGLWIIKFIVKMFCQNISNNIFLSQFFCQMFLNILRRNILTEFFSSKSVC